MLVVVTTVSAWCTSIPSATCTTIRTGRVLGLSLSLFTFFMLMLVTADNLVQMFFGWEGVGLASYLLIGFWYEKPVGQCRRDQGLRRQPRRRFRLRARHLRRVPAVRLGHFDDHLRQAPAGAEASSSFRADHPRADRDLPAAVHGRHGQVGAVGLHTWLPDAMEGPTPVSALIHAATMVTAGVFMVARLSPLFEYSPDGAAVVTFIGAITAFFAATVGLVQNDIKRVIAYSTCSQLGYMFFACGVGLRAGIFHLFTHAFFKALLFLGAGSVIHAMSDEQDMRKMGGIWKHDPDHLLDDVDRHAGADRVGIPGTLFGTAGFFSKDAIIESAFVGHNPAAGFAFGLLVIAALLTAFYSWRLSS
jgi:NADH-quinone oxidoreductase subunit L